MSSCDSIEEAIAALQADIAALNNRFIPRNDRQNIVNEAIGGAVNSLASELAGLSAGLSAALSELAALRNKINECCDKPKPSSPQSPVNLSPIYKRLDKIENYINILDGHLKSMGNKFKDMGNKIESIFKIFVKLGE